MTLVDLTQPFSDGMFSLSTLPRVTVQQIKTIEEDGVNITTVACSVHSGTHIDAPCHFIADGRDAAALALEDVSGDAVCIAVACEPLQEITARDLDRDNPDVRPGDIVLIHTGWGALFSSDPQRYHRHPFLAEDAAEWLVDRGAKMVALDIPTPDRPEELRPAGFAFPVHHILLGNDVLVAEHLAGLEKVAGRRARAYAFPIPIVHADGSAVRFVAEL
jgi:kynurenine formamidase